MISAKFLGPNGGSVADAIEAVKYITDLKTRHGANIVATNNSWGGGGYSEALHQAIIQAAKQNILFVAAAGNGGADGIGDDNDVTPHYPSSYANYGAMSVDIGAPGSDIYSTWPQNTYRSINGTSMATPHVTGAVAIYKAMNPAASAQQTRTVILAQGIPTPSLAGITTTGRRLNVGDFVPLPTLSIQDASVMEGHSRRMQHSPSRCRLPRSRRLQRPTRLLTARLPAPFPRWSATSTPSPFLASGMRPRTLPRSHFRVDWEQSPG
jgi:hypothetical protein